MNTVEIEAAVSKLAKKPYSLYVIMPFGNQYECPLNLTI